MGCKITKSTENSIYNPQGGANVSAFNLSSYSSDNDTSETTSSSFVYGNKYDAKFYNIDSNSMNNKIHNSNKYVVSTVSNRARTGTAMFVHVLTARTAPSGRRAGARALR